MNVHQLLSGAGPRDAITTEALAFRRRFTEWGWGGGDHAFRIAPGSAGQFDSAQRLAPEPRDVVLLHHSAGWPQLSSVLDLCGAKLLLYHNVTPAAWLWEEAPVLAAHCQIGREQLPALIAVADLAAADSDWSAGELRELGAEDPVAIPILLELERLGAPGPEPGGAPNILFVGRLSPHKRQDELIRAFALYRDQRAPNARLTLVGEPAGQRYLERLGSLARSLAPGAVAIESGLSSTQLAERYRSAHAFVCLSEHEGFGIPLLEAFHFGVPVIGRPAGAVSEVAGDAALLAGDEDLAVVAELLHAAVSDPALRAVLRSRAAQRLRAYEPARIAARLRAAIETTAARRRVPAAARGAAVLLGEG